MRPSRPRVLLVSLAIAGALGAAACSPSEPEPAASPVVTVNRSQERIQGQYGDSYVRQNDNNTVVAKVLAPAPAVWDALTGAMNDRKVTLTILDRGVGRLGDTSMVITRRWNNQPGSHYFQCGTNMTGERADDDRLRAVLLAQMTRLQADTIGVALHFSAFATPMSAGGSGSTAQCISTGRGESEFLDDVIRRVGGTGRRVK